MNFQNKVYLDKVKKHLSPFAQKVLATLIDFKKENSVCESINTYKQKEPCRNKKVIIFNDFASTLPDEQEHIKSFNEFPNVSTQEIQNTGCISTSSDLLLPIRNDAVGNILVNSEHRMIESTNPMNILTNTHVLNDFTNINTDYNFEEKNPVDWNKLFDNDFFNDFDDYFNSKDRTIQIEDKNTYVKDTFNLCFDSGTTIKHSESKDKIANDLIGKTITTSKRKNATRVSDKAQKVQKIQNEKIQSFRKEKYTKTVKNWLNNVDNSVEEIVNIKDDNVKLIDGNKKTKSKKTIQAQLANKGGIMKFAKPKETNFTNDPNQNLSKQFPDLNKNAITAGASNSKPLVPFITSEASNGKKTRKKTNENAKSLEKELNDNSNDKPIAEESMNTKAKEKKSRSKFVAPVLTPLPVKDVTYTIDVLNEHNINEHKALQTLTSTEVVMVLVYSNGFNQLNVQYASTDNTPEGVMFLINEDYYYVKDFGDWFAEIICQILSKNTLICFNAKEVLIFLMMQYDLSSCSFNIIDVKVRTIISFIKLATECTTLDAMLLLGTLRRSTIYYRIGASLLNPEDPPETFTRFQKLLNTTSGFTVATECVLQKCAWYMSLLKDCDSSLRIQLTDAGVWKLFVEIEMKALPIIAEMEHHGVCVDVDYLKSLESTLLDRMKEVEQKCYEAAGKSFQINSALQVRHLLYDELQLDTKSNIKIRETICKAKSTSEAMLRSLAAEHPLPALIVEYRRLHKAHATFVAGILQHQRDGVVRPTWDQTAAVTGRIACTNPNLQAIPKAPFSLTLYPEYEQTAASASVSGRAVSFRDVFPCGAGRALLAADFRHAECRVFALAAADAALQHALHHTDLFRVLAAQWLSKSEEDVTNEEREQTKRIVYASMYGAGTRKLSEILQISYEQALAVLTSFNRTFPSLKSFGRSVVSQCEQQGGLLRTPGGRLRTFDNICSRDFALRSHAERQAVNFIVQGSAADLCKAAMVATAERLRSSSPPLRARLVLQIHDELVWELPTDQLHRAAGVIKSAMEGCGVLCGLTATFPVELASGPRWGNLTPFEIM